MPKQRVVFAIDIGGTKIRGAVVSESGDILARKDIPSQAEKGESAAMKRLAALLRKMSGDLLDAEPVGIGMAIAGTVDPETGLILEPARASALLERESDGRERAVLRALPNSQWISYSWKGVLECTEGAAGAI